MHRDFAGTARLKAGLLIESPRKHRAGAEARAGPGTAGRGAVQITLQRRVPLCHRGKCAAPRRHIQHPSVEMSGSARVPSDIVFTSSSASSTVMVRWQTLHGKGAPSGFGARLNGSTTSRSPLLQTSYVPLSRSFMTIAASPPLQVMINSCSIHA